MASLQYTGNQQRMTVELGTSYTSGSGTMSLTAGHGARLPSSGDFWIKPTEAEISGGATYQVWKVTARSTDTLTVTGSQDGTTDTSVTAPMEMEWTLGGAALDQLRADLVGTDTDANFAAEKAGRIYLPSDGAYLYRDTGAGAAAWGPVFPCTVPTASDFSTAVNSGSVDDTYGPMIFTCNNASSLNLRACVKAVPSAPYTIIIAMIPTIRHETPSSGAISLGVCWRQSSDGKLVRFSVGISGGDVPTLSVDKHDSPTSSAVNYTSLTHDSISVASPIWLKMEDNSTNRISSYSYTGLPGTFIQLHSVGRTDYLTADQVGVIGNAGQNTSPITATVFSWDES